MSCPYYIGAEPVSDFLVKPACGTAADYVQKSICTNLWEECSQFKKLVEEKSMSQSYGQVEASGTITTQEESFLPAPAPSDEYQRAVLLHRQIMTNAEIAANALVEMCKGLKEMRDQKLYTQLGYETFDNYCEEMAGIKARQAYTYISTYEKLGKDFLQSTATFGITKLEMIAQLPFYERDDFMENNNVNDMSARELKEAVEKLTKQGEQISMLTEENEKLKKDAEEAEIPDEAFTQLADDLTIQLSEARKKIKELESRPIEVAVAEPKTDDKDIKKKIKEASDKAVEKALKQAEKDTTDKIKDAEKTAAKNAEDKLKSQLEKTEFEKAELLHRTEELSKKLTVSANEDMVLFDFNFEGLQTNFNKLLGLIIKMKPHDEVTAQKLVNAIDKYSDIMKTEVNKIIKQGGEE